MTKADFQAAIDGNQFRLVFQPKIDCGTLTVTGFEALARWDHPEMGLVMPDNFIPQALEFDLLGQITEVIVQKAVDWFAATPEIQSQTLSINLSAETLQHPHFSEWLGDLCGKAGVPTQSLILELSQSATLDNKDTAKSLFDAVKSKGFAVSIDRFGANDSSLVPLDNLPVTEIKLDRTIALADLKTDETWSRIRNAVLESHKRGVRVVTEGVEEQETLDFLRQIGCDQAQGYLISSPLSGNVVVDWLNGYESALRQNLV